MLGGQCFLYGPLSKLLGDLEFVPCCTSFLNPPFMRPFKVEKSKFQC